MKVTTKNSVPRMDLKSIINHSLCNYWTEILGEISMIKSDSPGQQDNNINQLCIY